MKIVIYAHPWDGSFCNSILQEVLKSLDAKKEKYQLIDLYKDGFNPTFTKEELALFSKGEFLDPLVGKYQEMLKNCSEVVLIFPIWWSHEPAILKGFIDKVFLQKFAYVEKGMGLQGLLINIKKVTAITTSTAPTFYLRFMAGNYVNKVLLNTVFKSVGAQSTAWYNCGTVKKSVENREKFLKKVSGLL